MDTEDDILNKINQIKILYSNNRRILINVLGSFLVKGGAMIISLFALPAYLNYFNNQTVLGLWFTILSVLNWVLSFDLGLGNGLRNKLTSALAKNEILKAKYYISSSYILIGCFSAITSLLSYFIFPYINWNGIFNISRSIVDEETILYCVRIVFIGIMIQFFLKLINSILYALLKPALNNFLALLSNVIILIFVLSAHKTDYKSGLITLAYVNVIAVNIPLLLANLFVFKTSLKEAKPKISYYNKAYAKSILSIGLAFFFLQFASILIGNTNEFLISSFIDPKYVVEYQPYNKLFSLFITLYNLALVPLWSEVTKAKAENNIEWIINLHALLCKIALISGILLILIIPTLPFIVKLWLGSTFNVHLSYSFTFVIYTILMLWNGANCSIANGLGLLKAQLIFLVLGAIINIPLAHWFASSSNIWISIIVANIISLLPICITQPIYLRNEFKKMAVNKNVPV